MLKEKYQAVLDLAGTLNARMEYVKEEGGKLHMKGATPHQIDKDLLWDKIKTLANWQNEISADLRVEKTDIYGNYTIQSGDTLSKLAKSHLGDAKRYMEIFNINKDVLSNPDLVKVGQQIKLPNK
jgi:LysM repeat protein